jgi:DNA ligase (NAD+)
LGIRFVGETVSTKLAAHFLSLSAIASASEEELAAVPEIGSRIAQSVFGWFREQTNMDLVQALEAAGLQTTYTPPEIIQISDHLAGLTFLITGTFDALSREALGSAIEQAGGKLASGVSAKLSYLVAGNAAGASKLDKARKLNVAVIDEAAIMAMLTPQG